MLKKLIGLIMAASIFASVIPVYAAQSSKNDAEAKHAEIEAQALEDGVVLDESVPYIFDHDATQEPEEDNEENIHTETIAGDIELQEESEKLLDETEFSLFSAENYSDLWKSLFSDYFGDDYLSPYSGNKDGQSVSGKTNRLVIEETDLSLPGKNGLDLNIRRKHDNQYYNHVYSRIKYNAVDDIYVNKYGYGFTNNSTNENIYVLFTNADDFYIYMKDGITISSLPNVHDSKKVGDSYVKAYLFEDIYRKKSDTGIKLTYNSSMQEINDTESSRGLYDLEDRKLLPKKNFLGNGWDLILPSASLHRYSYDTDTDGYPKTYAGEYIGAFRDIDGNVFSFEGYDKYTRYQNSDSTYTSSFYCDENKYFKITGYYAVQSLYEDGPQYNFEIEDNRGINYYFFNIDLAGKPSANQRMYIAAIQDEYGNTIRYEYGDSYNDGIVKIIDTYGREVDINHTSDNTVISYTDDSGIERQIVYSCETLPASSLNTGILKDKDVSRFSVTNTEGETTIYDSRCAYVSNVITTGTTHSINEVPVINSIARESVSYNIERIIYPTGAETRYLYKRLYSLNKNAKIINGLYGVESTYDIDDGDVLNKKEYQFASASDTITKTITDVSKSAKSVETYNKDGLLTKSITSANGTVTSSPYISVTNTYDENNNLKKQVVNNTGISDTTEYTYNLGYPQSVASITTDRSSITYTYHSAEGRLTNIPNITTYKFKSGSAYETDYSVENTINEQKSIVMTKKIKDNSIKEQSKYVYDSCGRVISTIKWTGKNGSDEVLDENDKYVQVNTSYSETAGKAVNIGIQIENPEDADGSTAEDVSERYKCNIYGYPIEKDDTYGIATNIAYDSLSRPTQYTYANGAVRKNVYNTAGKYTIITDEAGTQIKNTYNGFGKLLTKQYNDNGTWKPLVKYTYDSSGRTASCISYTNSDNYTKETYEYDVLDRIIQKIVYKGLSSRLYTENYSYTVSGDQLKIVKTTSAADNSAAPTETEYYDKYGRLIKKEVSSGAETMTNEYTYDCRDNMLTETDAKGNITAYEYDFNNRMIRKTLPDNHVYTWGYDMLGRTAYSFDSAPFAFTTYKYDALNREIYRRTPFGKDRTVSKTYYDANSNIIKKLQQNNADDRTSEGTFAETLYDYDDMNNLIGVTSNDGSRNEAVQYWYDNANRVIAMQTGRSSVAHNIAIPSSGAITRYEYDALGHLSKETDALGNSSEYNNDYAGNIISGVDRNQNSFDYTYGPYGIVSSEFYKDDSEEREYYTYDSLGRLKQKYLIGDDGNDYEVYAYDAFGRVTEQSGSDYKNCYTYDLNSNVASYILKQDDTVKNSESYEYDEVNNLTKQNINGKIITYTYENGLLLKKNADGIETKISYNDASLPTSYVTSKGDTTYASYTYTYRLDGNRIGEEDTVNNLTKSYSYDNIGRLTGENISGNMNLNMTYSYDRRGNRTGKTVTGDDSYTVSSTYDNNNRLTKQTKAVDGTQTEGTQYYYDSNGNQTFKQRFRYSVGELMSMGIDTQSNDIESFTYNVKNQLTGYTKGSTNASYTYGANGLRKSKTVGNTTTDFIWNGQNLAAETKGGTLKNVYSYGPDGIQYGNINGSDIFYVKDAHGNTVTTLDGAKNEIKDYAYDAFGNQFNAVSSSDTNPFRYCGEYYDNESGNIYLRARYYDSSVGRFVTEDPVKDGLNWYAYCGGNPVMFVDPSGLEEIVVSGGAYAPNDEWPYEFIAPAIQKINDLKKENSSETISWIVSNTGYSDEQIQNIKDVADDLDVILVLIDSGAELQNYINSKNINTWELSDNRRNDPIRKFVVFSHGTPGSIELGYFHENAEDFSLDFNWIRGVFMEAFDNTDTDLYSCRAGNDINQYWGSNFAQEWVNVTGGRTWAPVGRTYYGNVTKQNLSSKIGRKFKDISANASYNYPTEDYSEYAYFMNFYRSW